MTRNIQSESYCQTIPLLLPVATFHPLQMKCWTTVTRSMDRPHTLQGRWRLSPSCSLKVCSMERISVLDLCCWSCLFSLRSWVPKHKKFKKYYTNRVSFETSFDSKQLKLELKLVSALSETKRLLRLFRFYTETESFGVSIEPKQTEEQTKQCDREHILVFFRKFRVVLVCFKTVLFVSVVSI